LTSERANNVARHEKKFFVAYRFEKLKSQLLACQNLVRILLAMLERTSWSIKLAAFSCFQATPNYAADCLQFSAHASPNL